MLIAFIPNLAQSIKASPTSFNKLIVSIIHISGFTSFNIASAFSKLVTFTPISSFFIISPISFPITFGFTSIAPTTSPPFSNTYLIVYTAIFPVPN